MITENIKEITDNKIIQRYIELEVRAGQQRTVDASNALVLEAKVFGDELTARGPETLRKLLPLLGHENCHVQVSIAMRCYTIALELCGPILWKLAQSHGPESGQAMVFLMRTDPAYREFLDEETDKSVGGTWWRDFFDDKKPR
ncbi:MAG TPA: hypothetical protein VK558_07360 [Patescibacteria group bacterium]|nr:hypothetical protein [Patescibacteria group bacterium]